MAKNKKTREEDEFIKEFKRLSATVPGFTSLVKLLVFLVICIIFIIIARIGQANDREERENYLKTTTTPPIQRTSYKKLLDNTLNSKANITITIGEETYLLTDVVIENDVVTGMYESSDTSKKFKIENGIIYEVKLGKPVENNDLFSAFEKELAIPTNLIKVLQSNKTIKSVTEENVTYSYDIYINEIEYNILVTIVDDQIVSITISNDTSKYEITYIREEKTK